MRTRHSPQLDLLVNPTWEQEVAREPLLAFSFYLSGRVNVLRSFADEVEDHLDRARTSEYIDFGEIERAGSLMWLWILGAYEVVRTVSQAKSCFAKTFLERLAPLKKVLSAARMPSAKMEKPGKRAPINSNRSPAMWLESENDLLVGDPTDDRDIRARRLLAEFTAVFASLKPEEVLSKHESSYTA